MPNDLDAPQAAAKPAKEKFPRGLLWLLIAAGGGGGVILILVVVRVFFFHPFRVPSGAMWPTIAIGDHIFIAPLDHTPVRGAVMVFPFPEHPDQDFVKRVVGTSGDEIRVKNGRIAINGWSVPTCVVGPASYEDEESSQKHKGTLEIEYLGTSTYLVFHDADYASLDSDQTWKVKSGEFFVMGDNRENSHDSRMWNDGQGGGVPNEKAKGTLRGHELPTLPPGAESLGVQMDACIRNRPAVTSPP